MIKLKFSFYYDIVAVVELFIWPWYMFEYVYVTVQKPTKNHSLIMSVLCKHAKCTAHWLTQSNGNGHGNGNPKTFCNFSLIYSFFDNTFWALTINTKIFQIKIKLNSFQMVNGGWWMVIIPEWDEWEYSYCIEQLKFFQQVALVRFIRTICALACDKHWIIALQLYVVQDAIVCINKVIFPLAVAGCPCLCPCPFIIICIFC